MKKRLSLVLAVCLIFGLCACGAVSEDKDTVTYRVRVTDEGGNPIAGAMVQLCLDVCIPGVTDEEGVAEFEAAPAAYKVSFLKLPEGYGYSGDEKEFHFPSGMTEMTLVLKENGK